MITVCRSVIGYGDRKRIMLFSFFGEKEADEVGQFKTTQNCAPRNLVGYINVTDAKDDIFGVKIELGFNQGTGGDELTRQLSPS